MYDFLDTSTPNSGLGTPLRSGGEIINSNFRKLHAWMESRSNIPSADIPTVLAGGPRYLLAAEFVPGDPMPLALYERTTTPSDVTHPAWVQSADLQWWKLVPQGGVVYIEQLGGKADSDVNGVTGRDNLGPLYRACSLIAWEINPYRQFAYELRFGAGHYRFSDTIEFHVCIPIRGIGGGFEGGGATYWQFPANKTFAIFATYSTTGETAFGDPGHGDSAGSSIEHITMMGKASSTDHARAGIHSRTIVHLRHVCIVNAVGDGFRIVGSTGTGTIADFSSLEHCSVHGCTRNALYINGNDANVCHISHFSAHGHGWWDGDPVGGSVGGCGVFDAAGFGNKYDNIHISGYGGRGVKNGGRAYLLITHSGEILTPPGPGPGELTTPGTNDLVWYDVGPEEWFSDAQYPAWSATPAVPHRPQIPFLSSGAGHVIDNLYIEGAGPAHIPGASVCYSGTAGGTKYSNIVIASESGIINNLGIGGRQTYWSGQPGYAWNGSDAYAWLGTRLASNEPDKGIGILSHYRDHDNISGSPFCTWRYYEDRITYGRGPNHVPFWEQTPPSTPRKFGRSTPVPDMIIFPDFALEQINNGGLPGDTGYARIYGIRDTMPTSGEHASGEFYFKSSFSIQGTAGSRYVVLGWARLTTGSSHVLNTDWAETRFLTGT